MAPVAEGDAAIALAAEPMQDAPSRLCRLKVCSISRRLPLLS